MITEQHQQFIALVAGGSLPKDAYWQAIDAEATVTKALTMGTELATQYEREIYGQQAGAEAPAERSSAVTHVITGQGEAIPQKHFQFIEMVCHGISYKEAYRRCVAQDATEGSCRQLGSEMAKLYQDEISALRRKMKRALESMQQQQINEWAEMQLLTLGELAARMRAIIDGVRGLNGDPEGKANYGDLLRGINMYLKVIGAYNQNPDGRSDAIEVIYPGEKEEHELYPKEKKEQAHLQTVP